MRPSRRASGGPSPLSLLMIKRSELERAHRHSWSARESLRAFGSLSRAPIGALRRPGVDLEHLRARLRQAFGDTLSDEFVHVMMRKLIDALAPSPHDELEETTLNAGLAIISSMQPQSELEALLAVQIVATGFSGLRFLRESHRQMTNDFIDVYGGYAERLLRLQADLLRTFDRHRRGNRQTVEVRHVHLHPGSQGVIGIVNHEKREGEQQK